MKQVDIYRKHIGKGVSIPIGEDEITFPSMSIEEFGEFLGCVDSISLKGVRKGKLKEEQKRKFLSKMIQNKTLGRLKKLFVDMLKRQTPDAEEELISKFVDNSFFDIFVQIDRIIPQDWQKKDFIESVKKRKKVLNERSN